MARELEIRVTVADADKAKQDLAQVDAEVSKLTQDLMKGATSLEQYEASMKSITAQQQKAKATIAEYDRGVRSVAAGQTAAVSSAERLARAVGGLVTAGAVIGAIKQTVDYATNLDRLARSTGITATGLQRLENIAVGTSTRMDMLANATSDLARRLGMGDESAVAGMNRLGLETQRFLALRGDEQFLAVARAMREIEDQTTRSTTAYLLYRDTGQDVLAALTADTDKLADSINTVADAGLEKIARAKIIWDGFLTSVQRTLAELLIMTVEISKTPAASAEEQYARTLGMTFPTRSDIGLPADIALPPPPLVGPAMPPGLAVKLQDEATARQARAEALLAAARLKLAEATHALYSELRNMEGLVLMEQDRLRPLVQQAEAGTPLTGPLPGAVTPGMGDVANLFDAEVLAKVREVERAAWIAAFGFQGMADGLENVGEKGKELEQIEKHLAGLAYELSPLHRGLSAIEDVLGGINNDFAEMVVVAARTIDTVAKRLAEGDILGAVTAGIAGAVQFIANIGGPSQEEIETRRMRDQWESRFDDPTNNRERWEDVVLSVQEAYARVGRSAEEANEAVARIWDADDPREYAAAVSEVDRVLRLIEDSTVKVEEAMERYGITVDQMGERWQAQRLDEQAQQLYQDYQLLIAAGAEQSVVLDAMGADINEYFQNAQRLGLAIPEAMRPILQAFVDQGKLVDENGQLITDLSNINFSENLTTQFRDLIGAVRDLVAVLQGELAPALSGLPAIGAGVPSVGTPERWHDGGFIDPASNVLQFIPRAHKGLAVDERLIIAQTGEGILSRGGMQRLGGPNALNALNNGEGGGSGVSVHVDARGSYFDDTTADKLANKVLDAINRGSGRSKFNAMKKVS